jgi:hypothetical protein
MFLKLWRCRVIYNVKDISEDLVNDFRFYCRKFGLKQNFIITNYMKYVVSKLRDIELLQNQISGIHNNISNVSSIDLDIYQGAKRHTFSLSEVSDDCKDFKSQISDDEYFSIAESDDVFFHPLFGYVSKVPLSDDCPLVLNDKDDDNKK